MKIEGKIIQIIGGEEKGYGLIKAKDCDYLNIRPIGEYNKKFWFISYTPKKDRFKGYWLFEAPFKVERPHNFKVGDILDINITLGVKL